MFVGVYGSTDHTDNGKCVSCFFFFGSEEELRNKLSVK